MIKEFPLGTPVVCRIAFTVRTLTEPEFDIFLDGLGLPEGIGRDPDVVLAEVTSPQGKSEVRAGIEIVRDGVGIYHLLVVGTLLKVWRWKGLGQDASGDPVAATPQQAFIVTP